MQEWVDLYQRFEAVQKTSRSVLSGLKKTRGETESFKTW